MRPIALLKELGLDCLLAVLVLEVRDPSLEIAVKEVETISGLKAHIREKVS